MAVRHVAPSSVSEGDPQMRLRISNGTLISSRGQTRADLVCRDGRIERVGDADETVVDEEIDAHGLLEFPNAIPPVTSAAIFEDRAAQHGRVASVDFGLWGLALGSENVSEIAGLFAAGAVGVKLFWGYALHRVTQTLVYNVADEAAENLIQPPGNGDVLELCREVAQVGGLLAAHCEDRGLIDAAERALGHPIASYAEMLQARTDTAESVSIAIAGELSAASGCRFHVVHTSSARGVQAVRRAQAEGVR